MRGASVQCHAHPPGRFLCLENPRDEFVHILFAHQAHRNGLRLLTNSAGNALGDFGAGEQVSVFSYHRRVHLYPKRPSTQLKITQLPEVSSASPRAARRAALRRLRRRRRGSDRRGIIESWRIIRSQKTALAAIHRRLVVVGTIGLLEQAAARGFIELPTALARLRQTNARLDLELIHAALACDQARRQKR